MLYSVTNYGPESADSVILYDLLNSQITFIGARALHD
ncbi:MAG: hypothetical protein GKR87_10300 [Kiritimatiellae bacterium]|nr:hypothetical protein [Kiritimatiellia bacterium]